MYKRYLSTIKTTKLNNIMRVLEYSNFFHNVKVRKARLPNLVRTSVSCNCKLLLPTYRIFKVRKWPLHITQNKRTSINVHYLFDKKKETLNKLKYVTQIRRGQSVFTSMLTSRPHFLLHKN